MPKLRKLRDKVSHWVVPGKVCPSVSTPALRTRENPRMVHSLSLLQNLVMQMGDTVSVLLNVEIPSRT